MKPKIVVIGLDGATFDVITPLVEKGLLPNIARLIREGVHGELSSTVHPITPQAWSSFLTGMNAGKHGIFDFSKRREGTYDLEFINASYRKGESIFQYLSRHNARVGAIAVPFTFPPEPVNGFMLSGMDAPAEDERAVYPKDLYEEIRNRFGNYYIHLASPVGRSNDKNRFWQDIQAEDKNRTDISTFLMEHHPCDLFMTTYNNTDRVQHQYLTYEFLGALNNGDESVIRKNLITKTYKNVDRELGRILDKTGDDTTVIIMSDHGSGPIRKLFFLNRWLEQNGLLKYRESGTSDRLGFQMIEKARYLSKRFLPRRMKGFIKGALPQLRDKVESYRFFSDIDWKSTVAYGFGMYGNIYINLKGREPHGIVAAEDFNRISEEIIEKLSDLKDPDTGETLIEKVYTRDELYKGPCVQNAPDLLIRWRDYSYYTSNNPGREKGSCFGHTQRIDSSGFEHAGTHRINGIFIASGNIVKQGQSVQGAHVTDIAPTILYALGRPVPAEMDGKVLQIIFTDDFLKENTPEYSAAETRRSEESRHVDYNEKESKDVEERLKGLGYL